jgi:hypothetical protein
MEKNEKTTLIKDIALALIYLSSWEERHLNVTVRRAWKGYDFGILDELEEERSIDFSNKAKSLYLTDEGIQKAMELVEKFKTAGKE